MKAGILSDSHGHVARTRAAVQLLLDAGAEQLIHCGDIGGEAVLAEMAGLLQPRHIPAYAVLGNVDWGDIGNIDAFAEMGIRVLGRLGQIQLDGRAAAILHGDNAAALQSALESGAYAYLFTGHTHEREDLRVGNTRLINPGAIYRAAAPSVAVLDVARDDLRFLPLPH
jgi:putative phosphoesterase